MSECVRDFRMARSRFPLLFDSSVGYGPRKPSDAAARRSLLEPVFGGENLFRASMQVFGRPKQLFFCRRKSKCALLSIPADHPNRVGTPEPCTGGGVAIATGMQRAELPRPAGVGERPDCPETGFCITSGSDAVAGPVNLRLALLLLLPLPTP